MQILSAACKKNNSYTEKITICFIDVGQTVLDVAAIANSRSIWPTVVGDMAQFYTKLVYCITALKQGFL
jgi:hypothetical protein